MEAIRKCFERENRKWGLQLPDLEADFGHFVLKGGFDYSYIKSYEEGVLKYIDLKISHRMTSDWYERYLSDETCLEMDSEIMRRGNFRGIPSDEFEAITRIVNLDFSFKYAELGDIDYDFSDFEFFWSNDSPFSQWHKAEFALNGTKYSSAEQFMMAKKAELFGDKDIKAKILSTNNVRKQKELGRQVSGFEESIWNQHKMKIVYIANNLKFNQNPKLKQLLLDSEGKYIVEASPVDAIWGIGIAPKDPRRFDKSKWRGQNLLGKVLTQLREDMIVTEKYKLEY